MATSNERMEFQKKCKDWLEPLGGKLVYSNHPCLSMGQFDFQIKSSRVSCYIDDVNSTDKEFCRVSSTIFDEPFCYSLQSGRFAIGNNDVLKAVEQFAQVHAKRKTIININWALLKRKINNKIKQIKARL